MNSPVVVHLKHQYFEKKQEKKAKGRELNIMLPAHALLITVIGSDVMGIISQPEVSEPTQEKRIKMTDSWGMTPGS